MIKIAHHHVSGLKPRALLNVDVVYTVISVIRMPEGAIQDRFFSICFMCFDKMILRKKNRNAYILRHISYKS